MKAIIHRSDSLLFAATLALAGCASSGGAARGPLGVTSAQKTEEHVVRAGAARVVGFGVSPLAPVLLDAEAGAIRVRFRHPRSGIAVASLDGQSLQPLSPERPEPAGFAGKPGPDPVRVPLRDGRSVVCWKRGDAAWGYRVLAQAFAADGSPLGAPVTISADADVIGTPQAISPDGEHLVAFFNASSPGSGFALLAVPVELH